MNLIIFAALIAACGAAKLDRTYLPPASAATAGGNSGILQTTFSRSNQGTQSVEDIPPGGFLNQHQGVVVDAASADTRATNPISGLGAPRISYGSTASKVGEAAFRVTATNQYQYNPGSITFGVVPGEPDLSAFHQPISSSRPGNFQIIRDYVSNTVKYHNDIDNDKYNYAFETDNGIKASENGVSTDGVQAQGGYSYTGDDGKVYSVVYTAGEDGYQPTGNHLPTPPPIPEEILKSLEQNAKEEAAGVVDDGSYDAQKYNTEDDYTKNDSNGKYNDKQSNKFGDRPGSGSNGFINQNHQAFVSSNFNGQFGFDNNVKVPTFSKPSSPQFGNILGQNNGFNNKNEYLPPKGTSFGKPFSYDASKPGLVPFSTVSSKPTFSAGNSFGHGNSNSPFNTGSSFGNGNLNSPFNTGNSFGKGNSNSPFNTGSSFGNGNSNSPFNTGGSFGNGNLNSPFNTGGSFGNGNLNSPFNTGSSFGNGNSNLPFPTGSSLGNVNSNSARPGQIFEQRPIQQSFGGDSSLNQGSFTKQPTNSNDNSASNFGIPTGNVETNPNINNGFSGSKPSGIFNPSHETSLDSTLKPVSPTKQPQLTLTTPLESFEDSNSDKQSTESDTTKSDNAKEPSLSFIENESGQTNSDSDISPIQSTSTTSGDISKGASTIESFPQKSQEFGSQSTQSQESLKPQILSSNKPKDVDFASTTQRPSYSPTSQLGQSQGPDDSYVYNRPSTPFYTPSSPLDSNENIKNSSQFDKVTPSITSQTSLFTKPPQVTFSFNSQESTKYPNPPTLAQIVPGTSTSQYIDQKQNGYQQNTGITQASISPFPSLTPTVSYNFKQPSQFGFKPNQQTLSFNSPSVSAFSQTGPTSAIATAQTSQEKNEQEPQEGNKNTPNQQYDGQVYEYNVPTQGLSSQNQEPLNITETEPTSTSQLGDLNTGIDEENLSITSSKQDSTLTPQSQAGEQTSNLFNQGSSISTSSQKPTQIAQFGLESGTQFTQDSTFQNQDNGFSLTSTTPQFGLGISNNQEYSTIPHFSTANKQTSTQSGFDTVKPTSSLSQNQPELSNTGSQIQQPNKQATPQFGYKPSTIFPSSLQTQSSGFSIPTPVTPIGQQSILTSSKKPSTQLLPSGTQSGSVFGQGNFYNKVTVVPQSFQQSGTKFGYKPTTVFPSTFQTQTNIFNTPTSATQQQNIFTSSKKPFGSQSSFQFGQGSSGNKETVPVFQQSGNQSGYRPSTIGTSQFQPQVGQQSISTSPKTPSSQQITFGSQPTSQFGTGNLNNKGTTVPQFQQPNQKTNGSAFAQTNIFYSPRPTTQFEQSSFPAKLPTSQTSQPGLLSTTTIGQTIVNNKESSYFQYQKPNQEFGTQFNYKPTTSIPTPETSSFSNSKIPSTQSSQLNIQSSSPFGQSGFGNKGTTVPQFQSYQQPGTFGYKPSSLPQPQGSAFSSGSAISQIGQTSDSTVAQKPIGTSFGSGNSIEKTTSQQTVNAFNKPSTLLPSTSQGTQFGEIYDYQKPAQNFVTPSESDNSYPQSQFSVQSNIQQGLANTQKESEQSEQSGINASPDSQLNQASIHDKDTSFNPFSQQKPGTAQAQSSFSFDQTTTTGEIYEYIKPDQGLHSSEKEGTQFGQKLQGSQIEQQPSGNGENINTNQETSTQLTQSTLTGSFGSQNLDSSTTEAPSSTNGNTFAFHSACCGGSIINKQPVSQNNLKPNESFGQNNNPQKGSQTFAGVGEQFGGPRKPPSFDETGYHY